MPYSVVLCKFRITIHKTSAKFCLFFFFNGPNRISNDDDKEDIVTMVTIKTALFCVSHVPGTKLSSLHGLFHLSYIPGFPLPC